MSYKKPEFIAYGEINSVNIAFFTPPHDEADFPWVDVKALALAFLPEEAASRMVRHAQNFDRKNRAAETASHDDRILTIIPHPMAQGLCDMIDIMNGHVSTDENPDGVALMSYCAEAAKVYREFWPAPAGLDGLFEAFANAGGPNMRSMREGDE